MKPPLPLLPLLVALLVQDPRPAPEPPGEIILLAVRQGSTAGRAGLRPGDVVRSWRRLSSGVPADRGELASPFDWTQLFLEHLPRATMELRGTRGGEEKRWVLPGGAPMAPEDSEARPALPGDLLRLFEQGRERAAAGDAAAAAALWHTAAGHAGSRGERPLARWLTLLAARSWQGAGRADKADALYHRLINGFAAEATGTTMAAQLLREWAAGLRQRGLWDRAAAADRRALALDRRNSAENLAAAWSLSGLGYTASWSAGAEDPDRFFRQALAIRERWAPGSAEVATSWWDRGNGAASDGDYRRARDHYRRAVSLMERAAPGSLYLAARMVSLGRAEYFLGDLEAANRIWRQALGIAERQAPRDRVTAGLLQGVGIVELERENWQAAAHFLGRAWALSAGQDLDPLARTSMLVDLARAERRLGRKEESADHFCSALEILDEQRRQLAADPEIQLLWSSRFFDYHRNCAQALVDLGQTERAFGVLERGRARSFLNLETERPAPENLAAARAGEWRRLDAEYDRIQQELAELHPRREGEWEAVFRREGRMREIQRRKRQILAESRPDISPDSPASLDFAAAARALDPGTVLLSFATTRDQTLLFVVEPAPGRPRLSVFALPSSRRALEEKVETFRTTLIEDRFRGRELEAQATRLYNLLLRPAEALLARSERLLILPDGPLHTLPFAALIRHGRFLAEDKPLHFAVSAATYAQAKKRRRPRGDPSRVLLAFGDPFLGTVHPRPVPAAIQETDPAPGEGRGLSPLPEARREILGIAPLFPRARVFTGGEATEGRVRQEAGHAALLHFAVHARLDDRMPANSALVLSPPAANGKEPDNGLLQGWEITEELALDADLVTLSACDTALGTDMGGEGLIGLTSAFQQAGARSVVATLWGISDAPSAALMQHFYAALKEGKSKDEALRQAQIRQLRSRDAPEPFYWAAFQLYGDWQ